MPEQEDVEKSAGRVDENQANNAEVAVVVKRSVKLEVDCGEATWNLTMSDMLCAPDLAINLLSVARYARRDSTPASR